MSVEVKKLVKVDGEIAAISCELCGRAYGILVDHFCTEMLSLCRCGQCQYPLFSSEELRANQCEDC